MFANHSDQTLKAGTGHCGDQQHFPAQRIGQLRMDGPGRWQLGLRDDDDLGPCGERFAIAFQFQSDGPVIGNRIRSVHRHRFDKVHEDSGPFDMSQELMSESDSTVRAFDQARNIGQDERGIGIDLDASQVGVFGSKWIVGNLRPGTGNSAQESTLAGIRHSDETDVCDDLEFQQQSASFTLFAACPFTGSLMCGRLETSVSATTLASAGGNKLIAVGDKVLYDEMMLRVHNQRARRHEQGDGRSASSLPIGSAPVTTRLGIPALTMGQGVEAIDAGLGNDEDASAIAPIASIRTASRNIALATKTAAAVAASPGPYIDLHPVNKHCLAMLWELAIRSAQLKGPSSIDPA